MRRIEVCDGVVAETRIEREGVLAASDRPCIARRRDELVLPVSGGDDVVCPPYTVSLPLPTVIVLPTLPWSFTTSPLPLPTVIVLPGPLSEAVTVSLFPLPTFIVLSGAKPINTVSPFSHALPSEVRS